MVSYSDRALWARRKFFEPYNDVTIIVEDVGQENFYTKVFQRLLQGKVRVKRVIGVGGKHKVMEQFSTSQTGNYQPEFFLVDGDFDEILGRICPTNANFYRLPRYDIENYLIEEPAVCSVAEEQSPGRSAQQHQVDLQFEQWLSEVISNSIRLVAAAALWQDLGIRGERVSQAIVGHSQNPESIPDMHNIEFYIERCKAAQTIVRPAQFDVLLQRMVHRMGTSVNERRQRISGKHILIPLIIRLLNKHTGTQVKRDSLCFRLASKCEFTELQDLRDRVLAISNRT